MAMVASGRRPHPMPQRRRALIRIQRIERDGGAQTPGAVPQEPRKPRTSDYIFVDRLRLGLREVCTASMPTRKHSLYNSAKVATPWVRFGRLVVVAPGPVNSWDSICRAVSHAHACDNSSKPALCGAEAPVWRSLARRTRLPPRGGIGALGFGGMSQSSERHGFNI